MFYVFALIVIMSVTPWSSVVPEKSPFVELFVLVGLPAAASVINFVVLTSAASSANSGVFLYQPYAVWSGAGRCSTESVR